MVMAPDRAARVPKIVPLQKYIDASGKLDLSDIEWSRVREWPIDQGVRESLIYMADVELYVIAYLRDLINTRAIDDHEVARFMTLWAYEELFHCEALHRFLAEYGIAFSPDHGRALRKHTAAMDRLIMMGGAALTYATRDFVAVYMTWGAINELSTAVGYTMLADRCGHPILAKILRRIAKDEWRHHSFYQQQARRRLERPLARWLTSAMIRAFWRPVGNGVKAVPEMYKMVGYCFQGPEGRAAMRDLDERVRSLPGLGWFRGFEDFLEEIEGAGAAWPWRAAGASER